VSNNEFTHTRGAPTKKYLLGKKEAELRRARQAKAAKGKKKKKSGSVPNERRIRTAWHPVTPGMSTSKISNDHLSVPTDELMAVLEPYVRSGQIMVTKSEWRGSNFQTISNLQSVAFASGVSADTVANVVRRVNALTALDLADRLLTAVGENRALWDGRVKVVRSTRYSPETLRKWLAKQGVDESIVHDMREDEWLEYQAKVKEGLQRANKVRQQAAEQEAA
jgi:hypothetical protein